MPLAPWMVAATLRFILRRGLAAITTVILICDGVLLYGRVGGKMNELLRLREEGYAPRGHRHSRIQHPA